MLYVLRYPLGFAALCAAVYFFYKTITKKSAIKACNGYRVDATVVDYTVQALGNGMVFYYLVYEYEVDGDARRHTSTTPLIKPVCVGSAVKLPYNKATNEVVDQTNIVADATVALICGALSLIILNL